MAIDKVELGIKKCPVMVCNSRKHDEIDEKMREVYKKIQEGIKRIEYNEAKSWEKARTRKI